MAEVIATRSSTTIPAVFISHRRGRKRVHPTQSLLRIEGVCTREEAKFFIGNCVASAYVSEGRETINYGRISRVHGNSGVLVARFKRNLPPQNVGKELSVKLYKVEEDDF